MNLLQATSASAAMLAAVIAAPVQAEDHNFRLNLDGLSGEAPEVQESRPLPVSPEGLDFPNYIIGEDSCYIPKPEALLMV